MRHLLLLLFVASCSTDVSTEQQAVHTQTATQEVACDESRGTPATFMPGEKISPCGRPNPLAVAEPTTYELNGVEHVLRYPVETTGILVPYRPLRAIVEGETDSWFRKMIAALMPYITQYKSVDDIYRSLGLVDAHDGTFWGATVIDTPLGEGLTFSCATCHTGSLFGTPVFGMHNRMSRANAMFVQARPAFDYVTPGMFDFITGATDGERQMWANARQGMHYVSSISPRVQGLDTALAHTMLSLVRRAPDEWATLDDTWKNPRYTPLETHPVDVKPATWWLTKYKTAFFSDGSQVSGNPVLGALLVNELGRGTDMHVLDAWIEANWEKIEELTTAIFAAEAPSYFSYFPREGFDVEAAKRGEVLFKTRCAGCHGTYEKDWQQGTATVQVRYFEETKVKNVGTDPDRAAGIAYLQEINELALAKKYNLVLTQQDGYVPPPLVGVWARWPYFHNGSAQSLCVVLTSPEDRPVTYVYGEVLDRHVDFDVDCNGYPTVAAEHFSEIYDTRQRGLHATGHDMARDLSPSDKRDLIRFLQTL